MHRKQIVLLGIGHTNADVVKRWQTNPIPDCDLICISQFPHATYSGMLPAALGGQCEPSSMKIDLAALCNRSDAKLVLAETIGLDTNEQTLRFQNHDPVTFDLLSIGVGSMPSGHQVVADLPVVVPIKPMQSFLDRLQIRLAQIPQRDTFRVVVVGGGVASVEIAFCLQQFLRAKYPHRDTEIQIVTAADQLAGELNYRSARRLHVLFRERDIHVITGARVNGFDSDSLTTEDGSRIASNCVIWATGAVAPAVLAKLNLKTDDRGFIATTSTLQSISKPNVFAVGDSGTIIESPAPKAGVYAVRQAPILWHNLNAMIAGTDLKRFNPQASFLKLLNTGDQKALLEYGRLTAHGKWCRSLKHWIDQRFIQEFQSGGLIGAGDASGVDR